ncbi:MAG: lytic transglycosylase domain-containing protein [Granulosicoccus sp.]
MNHTCFFDKPTQFAGWGISIVAAIALSLATLHAEASPFKHRAADGTMIFSDAPINNGEVVRTRYSGEKRKPSIANPCKGLSTTALDMKGAKLEPMFAKASKYSGVSATLLKAVARAESCFDSTAVSRAGARGLMQLMPKTAMSLNIKDSFNPQQNIMGGARYLSAMLARYSNNLDLALAAYNAGPGNVDRYDGVPPFKETRRYINSVKAFQNRYKAMQQPKTQLAASEETVEE